MKITRRQLKQIIKEELARVLSEQNPADALLAGPTLYGPGPGRPPANPLAGPTLYGPGPAGGAATRSAAGRALGTAGRIMRGAPGGPLGVAAAVAPVVASQLSPGSYSQGEDTRPITTDTPQDPGTRTNIGRAAADPAPVYTATGVGMMEPHERAAIAQARRRREKKEQAIASLEESTQQKLQRMVHEELAQILNLK